MKHLLFLFIAATALCIPSNAQTAKQKEKLEKIESLLKKNKIKSGDKKLVKLLESAPSYGDAWDLLANLRHYQYQQSKKELNIFSNMTVTTTDEDGNEIKDDSLANSFMEMLKSMSPEQKAYDKYIYTLRQATSQSKTAFKSSIYLRGTLRDVEVDTAINDSAFKYFKMAEEEFVAKNYNEAAILYQKALDEEPNYYKALLYLGDAYYAMQNYIDAIKKFKVCSERFPEELEPHKYLTDAYYKEGLMDKALETAIVSKTAYPDLVMQTRMESITQALNKNIVVSWQARDVLPNKISTSKLTLVANSPFEDQPEIEKSDYWKAYSSAVDDVKDFCSEKGLITQKNKFTSSQYLEVYSWEKMLSSSNDPELSTARKMKEKGYLDCYVFITCFHDDLYDQYRHFVDNNKDKVVKYYEEVVIKN